MGNLYDHYFVSKAIKVIVGTGTQIELCRVREDFTSELVLACFCNKF